MASTAAMVAAVFASPAAAERDPACGPGATVIATQPLADALVCLSRISGAAVFADAAALEDYQAPQVRIDAQAAEIAARLAVAAPVQVRAADDGTILVSARPDTRSRTTNSASARSGTTGVEEALVTDVILVRGFAFGYASALARKRDALGVIETINSEEAGRFPDQNLAESVQRLPGLSMIRRNGEGEAVSIRGLSPEFTRIEIDGRTTIVNAETSDPERASLLSVFNPDLYARIEVVKTPGAADSEGGLGGIVRLITPDPLDLPERAGRLELRAGAAPRRDDGDWGVSGFLSTRGAAGERGVYVAGAIEQLDRRVDSIQATRGWMNLQGLAAPERLRAQQRAGERMRSNFSAKAQWRTESGTQLEASALYARDDRDEARSRLEARFNDAALVTREADERGLTSAAQFDQALTDLREFRRDTIIETYGGGLEARLSGPGDATARFYAGGQSSEERWREHVVRLALETPAQAGFRLAGDGEPISLFADISSADPGELQVTDLEFRRRILTLQEAQAGIDADGSLDREFFTHWRSGTRIAGARYQRRQGALDADFIGLSLLDAPDPLVAASDFAPDSAYAGVTGWPGADPVSFYSAYATQATFEFDDENTWTIEEGSVAVYGLLEFAAPKVAGWSLEGDAGLRLVHTRYRGRGRLNIQVTETETEYRIDDRPAERNAYTQALPSLRLRADRDDGWVVRAAVGRGLSRPTLSQIQPGVEVNTEDGDIVRGRPDLQPFGAWSYDLTLEHYFGTSGVISIGLFHKDADSFVVPTRTQEVVAFPEIGLSEAVYQVESWRNGGAAQISGVEWVFQTPLDTIWRPLSGFGVYANATFTDSEFSDDNGRAYTFPGASRQSWNLALWYERAGFSTRLAWASRSRFLLERPDRAGLNASYGAGAGRLDLAVRHRFESGLQLSLDAFNLNGVDEVSYWDEPGRLQAVYLEDRTVTVGLGWRF
ncbi:MAG: TonB-dependent receptor [Pseudomonadota bacterium]